MLQVFNLEKSYTGHTLFEKVTFAVGKNERLGLVGRNGSGKSTIFKLILGQESADSGEIIIPKAYKLGHLNQHIHFTKPTVIEECCQVLSEEEQYDFYKAEKILFGLGFEEEDMYRSPEEFSGGYQLRINLTKTLLEQPNLLLLDEPTNYLDIVSLRWMRKFLKSFQGEVVIITHDRDFMDSVTTHTMGLYRGGLKKVKGSTEKYYEQLTTDEEVHEKTRMNQEKKIKDMQKYVDRFRAKASKATQAQSKMKQIEKMKVLEELNPELSFGFRFNFKQTPAKKLMSAENLSFSYSGKEEDVLFKGVSFEVKPKDRIAIVGKNGKGKTTLLDVLAGDKKPLTGELKNHPGVSNGYYQQTNRKNLHPNMTVAQEIEESNIDLSISQVRAICGAMMFSGGDADKKVKVLSGGEQGRVLLGKILATPTNLLLLDEPSNHLDMDSIDVLTSEIEKFPGGVVLVTHNEEMLRRLANKLVVFRQDSAEVFLGTYDEFLEKIGWDEEGSKKKAKKEKVKKAKPASDSKKEEKKLLKELESLETKIEELETELKHANNKAVELSQKAAGGEEAQKLYKSIGGIQATLDSSYQKMNEVLEGLEKINDSL